MQHLILEITKYFIIVFMGLYTLTCFTVFKPSNADRKSRMLNKQIMYVFMIHFLCYLSLFIRIKDDKIIVFYIAQIVVGVAYMVIYHTLYPKSSRVVTNNMCFLLLIGYTMLTRIDMSLAYKQFAIATVALVLVSVIPLIMIKIKSFRNYSYVYGILGVIGLSSVFVLGISKYGATNWISIAGISIQPSEFVKIIYVFFIASMLAKSQEFKNIVITTGFVCLHLGVLVLEKDLGGAVIFFIIYLFMLFCATGQIRYIVITVVGGMGAAGMAFLLFKDKLFRHVGVRIQAWKDPWSVIDNQGYQIAQSLFAIGTGGWIGSGLANGSPRSIPVSESDFIFSAIAEELGVIFALALILVCFSCFICFINIALRARNMFYKNMALGFAVCYVFQVFLTLGGVTKFIPSTGVTLPLVSYGGSSVLSTLIIFSIMQGICVISNKEAEIISKEKRKLNQNEEDNQQSTKRKSKKKSNSGVKSKKAKKAEDFDNF